MMARTYTKDPDATLNYGHGWGDWLETPDTIVGSLWLLAPDGLTQSGSTFTDTDTAVRLSGGTVGVTYTVTNRVTTAAGLVDDRSFRVWISDR
jgi:hypothetical protein